MRVLRTCLARDMATWDPVDPGSRRGSTLVLFARAYRQDTGFWFDSLSVVWQPSREDYGARIFVGVDELGRLQRAQHECVW